MGHTSECSKRVKEGSPRSYKTLKVNHLRSLLKKQECDNPPHQRGP